MRQALARQGTGPAWPRPRWSPRPSPAGRRSRPSRSPWSGACRLTATGSRSSWDAPAPARPTRSIRPRAAWEAAGDRVLGAAPAARAAAELEAGAGIPSMTVARPLQELGTRRLALDRRTVVVVDEAGMLGTRDTAALATPQRGPAPSWCWSATTRSRRRSPPAAPYAALRRGLIPFAWRATGASASPGSARPCSTCARGVPSARWPPTSWPGG